MQSKLQAYQDLLLKYNDEFGLLGPREIDKIMDRHIYNSLNLLEEIPKNTNEIIDIGSGAGLPGIPLAIALPNTNFKLVEPKQKRVKFLNICKRELGLENIEIIDKSIQEIKSKPDIITARAVADLSKLLTISKHLWSQKSIGIFLKGENVVTEIDKAKEILKKMRLQYNIEKLQYSKDYEPSTIIKLWTKI